MLRALVPSCEMRCQFLPYVNARGKLWDGLSRWSVTCWHKTPTNHADPSVRDNEPIVQILRLANDFSRFHLPRLPKLVLYALLTNVGLVPFLAFAGTVVAIINGAWPVTAICVFALVIGVVTTALLVIVGVHRPYSKLNRAGFVLTMKALFILYPMVVVVVVPMWLLTFIPILGPLLGVIIAGTIFARGYGKSYQRLFAKARQLMACDQTQSWQSTVESRSYTCARLTQTVR